MRSTRRLQHEMARAAFDVDRLLEQVLRVICDVLNYPNCAILLLDEARGELYIKAALGYSREAVEKLRIPLGQGLTGLVAQTRQAVCVGDVSKEPRYIKGTGYGRSEIAVPLMIGDKLIGVLDVESGELNAFGERDLRVLSLFASQAALAIEYARLYEKEKKRSAQLALINEISKKMAESLEIDELLREVVRSIQSSFNYYHVMVLEVDRARGEVAMRAQAGGFARAPDVYRRKLGQGIVGHVAETGCTILANDVTKEPYYLAARPETRSELCVPIKIDGQVWGVINVESRDLNAFDENDVIILETISDQLARAVTNARIYAECKEAKDYLQKLVESSSDAITTTDIHGRLTFWSKGAEEIFGYTAEEALGRPARSFYAAGVSEARRVMQMLKREEKIKNWETEFIGKNGRRIHASLSVALLRDEEGNPTGTLGIIRDISQFKELQRQLIEAERLAAVGRLSTQVAHEIRNPLSSIKMNIQILGRQGLPEQAKRHLAIAASEVERLDRILQEIFDYVRPLKLELAQEDLNQVAERSLSAVLPRLEESGISVEKRYADLPKVWLDSLRLSQALTNLYINAINSMPRGGLLRISTSRARLKKREMAKIEISDNGYGISRANLKNIFEPFFTTRSDGIGLGLTIVKKIVEQHNGAINVRSREGKGTTFSIYFPL